MHSLRSKMCAFLMATLLVCAFGVACPSAAMASCQAAGQNKQVTKLVKIPKNDAKLIALNHAGLTKKQVKRLCATNAKRKDQPAYLITFVCGTVQFTYSINMYTGDIISYSASKITTKTK